MYISRLTFVVKTGHVDEALAILTTSADHLETRPPMRILTPYYAPGNRSTIVLEQEFESLAELERFWNAYDAALTPGGEDEFDRISEPGGSAEIWLVRAQS